MPRRRIVRSSTNVVASRGRGCLPIGCITLVAVVVVGWVLHQLALAVDFVVGSLRGPSGPVIGLVMAGVTAIVGLVVYEQRHRAANRKAATQLRIIAVGAGELVAFVVLSDLGARSSGVGWAALAAAGIAVGAFFFARLSATAPTNVRRAALFVAQRPRLS